MFFYGKRANIGIFPDVGHCFSTPDLIHEDTRVNPMFGGQGRIHRMVVKEHEDNSEEFWQVKNPPGGCYNGCHDVDGVVLARRMLVKEEKYVCT